MVGFIKQSATSVPASSPHAASPKVPRGSCDAGSGPSSAAATPNESDLLRHAADPRTSARRREHSDRAIRSRCARRLRRECDSRQPSIVLISLCIKWRVCHPAYVRLPNQAPLPSSDPQVKTGLRDVLGPKIKPSNRPLCGVPVTRIDTG